MMPEQKRESRIGDHVMDSVEDYLEMLDKRKERVGHINVWEYDLIDYAGNVSVNDRSKFTNAAETCMEKYGLVEDKNERTALLFKEVQIMRDASAAREAKWRRNADIMAHRQRLIYGALRVLKPAIIIWTIFGVFYAMDRLVKMLESMP